MANSIIPPSEQCRELAAIDGMMSALAIAAENYQFGELGADRELQEQCESVFVNMIPDLAQRIREFYESYHETHNTDGEVAHRAVTDDTPAGDVVLNAKNQKFLSQILHQADDGVARAQAACDRVEHSLQILRMPGLLSPEGEQTWRRIPGTTRTADDEKYGEPVLHAQQ